MVEIIVFANNRTTLFCINSGIIDNNLGLRNSSIYIPYITNEMLLPSNSIAINFASLRLNQERILPEILFRLLSNSILSLFAETKAISTPENRAEKRILTNMIIIIVSIISMSRNHQIHLPQHFYSSFLRDFVLQT